MKYVQILLLKSALLCSTITGFAQDESSAGGFEFGAKVGMVTSELSASYHTGSKLGFTAGGFAIYPVNEMISLQAELAYMQSGGSYVQFRDDSRFGGTSDFFGNHVKDADVTLHNIYVPVQARLSFFDNPAFPKLLIGPYMSYNVAATESYQKTGQINGGVFVTVAGEEVVSDLYKDFQIGAVVGLQFEISTDADYDVVIGTSYQYGITPVKESHSYIDFVEVTEDVTSNAITFSVGVKF